MRTMRAVTALGLALLSASCQPSAEAASVTTDPALESSPSIAPDGESVIYDRISGTDNADIWVLRERRDPGNLTRASLSQDRQPSYSPDGRVIAFRSEREGGGIFVMTNSGNIAHLLYEGYNPAWMPDGNSLVYSMVSAEINPYAPVASPRTGAPGIWLVGARNREKRQLTGMFGLEPEVSPNGERVAFWGITGAGQRDIFTVGVNDSTVVQVTNDAALDVSPVWSLDGTQLYFASDRDGAMKIWSIAVDAGGAASGEPVVVSTDAGAPIRSQLAIGADGTLAYVNAVVTHSLFKIGLDPATGAPQGSATAVTDPSAVSPVDPTVSPDGSMIAFASDGKQADIYVIGTDGSGLRQVTNDAARDSRVSWSADGTQLIYQSEGATGPTWQRVNADGSGATALPVPGDGNPVWSPDGNRVVYTERNAEGVLEIKVAKGDGTTPQVFANTSGSFGTPVWMANSQRIAIEDHRVGETTWAVFDVTEPARALRARSNSPFSPQAWSPDGKTIAGQNGGGDLPVQTVLYDVESRQYAHLVEGSQARWLDNNQLLVRRDAGSKIQVLDRTAKEPRDVAASALPQTVSYALSKDGTTLYYVVTDVQADIHRLELPEP